MTEPHCAEWCMCSLFSHASMIFDVTTLPYWERRGWSLEADGAKHFKIADDSFAAVTIQSSQPREPGGSGSRESSPVIPVSPVQVLRFCQTEDNRDKISRVWVWLAGYLAIRAAFCWIMSNLSSRCARHFSWTNQSQPGWGRTLKRDWHATVNFSKCWTHCYAPQVKIIDKLVLGINTLDTNHQSRPFFCHKDLMKEQNLQK